MSLRTDNPTTKYCKNLCQVLSRNKETAVILSSHHLLSARTLPSKMSTDDITVKNEVVSSGYISTRAHHISECVGPPIGVFWDIENCSIPFNKSAISIVTKIRHRFFNDHREAEFMCVCDISKENKDVIQELNYAQVTVVHINATSKNTADDKIRQLLRRFAADHPPPATVILISGDVNFASELSDLRYRHHLHVILIHRRSASSALLSCPHECYCFDDFVTDVEDRKTPETDASTDLLVWNLPVFEETTYNAKVRNRLRQLGSNCRGRVISIRGGTARIRFPNKEAMLRAQKRMNGEDVFGCKINVRFIDGGARQQRDQSPAISYFSSSTTGYQTVLASREVDSDPEFPRRSVSFSGSITLEPRHTSGRDENASRQIVQRNAVSFRSNCLSLSDFQGMCHISSNDAKNESHVAYQHYVGTGGAESPHCVFTSGDDADSDIIICGPTEEIVLEAETVDSAQAILDKVSSKSGTSCGGEKTKTVANETTERIIKSKRKKKNVVKSGAVEEPVRQTEGEQTKCVSSPVAERLLPTPSLVEMDNMRSKYAADNAPDTVKLTSDIESDSAVGLPEHKQRANSSCESIWPTKQLSEMAQSRVLSDSPFNPFPHSAASQSERPVGSLASQTAGTELPVLAKRGETDSRGVTNSVLPRAKGSCSPLVSSSDHVSLTGQTPSFRRTPGARRPNAGSTTNYGHRSPRANSNSPLVPRPLFPPSFTGMTSYGRFSNSSIAGGDSNVDRWISSPNFHHTSTSNKYNAGGLHVETEKYSGLGVELIVSNLDYKISEYDWKEILHKEFQQQVKVLSVSVQSLPDGLCIGYIRVPTVTDACHAVTLFHRRKIGLKRIHVAINEQLSPDDFKSEIVGLFHTAAVNSMPLSKLLEMYGKRYNHCCDLPQLYSMNDVVRISEGGAMGKIVSLVNNMKNNSPSTSSADEEVRELMESPVCLKHHTPNSDDAEGLAYVEAMDMSSVPYVNLQLRSFATRVHILLQSHGGSVSVASFPYCYAAEFERIHPAEESGVPLEHLIACVSGVQLAKTMSGVKKVEWAKNNAGNQSDVVPVHAADTNATVSVPLTQFSHDVVELLCHSPKCCLLLSNFGLAYHRRFGQICRIGDYGYHSLSELLDAISDVVQVIGEGSRRCVTLTHQVQIKRFTADLLKLLQSQLNQKISVADLPSAYEKLSGKELNVTEFGLCFIEDLLSEVADDAIKVSGAGADSIVYLTQCREETDGENIKRFAADIVQLLKHCPHYCVSFDCFMLSFKQHFGRECRLSDYGLTMKLNEVLEAIPRVCRVVNDPTAGRRICLTECELLRILESNVSSMLRSASSNRVSVGEFLCEYSKHFGHSLCLDDFGVHSIIELIEKLHNVVKVEKTNDGQQFIYLINSHTVWTVTCNILLILMDQSPGSLSVAELSELYYEMFNVALDVRLLSSDLSGFVEVSTQVNCFYNSEAGARRSSNTDTVVKLCPLQLFARDARTILIRHAGGRLPIRQFVSEYEQFFGVHLSPASYGHLTVEALIQAVPLVLSMRNKRVLLTPRFRDKLSSYLESKCGTKSAGNANSRRDENLMSESEDDVLSTVNGGASTTTTTTTDLLSEPVPSSVPSPDLQPEPHRSSSCLMQFDLSSCPQDFLVLTDDEKRGLKTPLCSTPNSDLLHFAAQFMPSSSRVSSTSADLRGSEVSRQSRLRNGDRNIVIESGRDLSGGFYAGVPMPGQQSNGANAIPYNETGKSPSLLGYPPMPASAQLVSVVQDQIRQAVVERSFSLSPSAASSEVSSCSTPAVICSTSDIDVVSTTVDSSVVEFRTVDRLSSSLSQTELDSTAGSTAAASRTRLTTPRRSRIVARINLLSTLNADPSANH